MNLTIKSAIIFVLTFFFFVNLSAQKKSADFTVVDSEGKTHHLYSDYLDKGKVVVIDLFYVDCPPCNEMAPFFKTSYEKWGSGSGDVVFLSLSPFDDDIKINSFHDVHQLLHPASGPDGGGDEALTQYTNDFFGTFFGYPTLLLIKPNGEVVYDIKSSKGHEETFALLDVYIGEALKESITRFQLDSAPNPSVGDANLILSAPEIGQVEIQMINSSGQLCKSFSANISQIGKYDFGNELKGLSSGVYEILVIVEGAIVAMTKIIIL